MNNKEMGIFLDETIEDIFAKRFSNYSKYIIQDRALPDVRDGLKPVQRRILYAMYKDGNVFQKQYRKSAKTVGNVIGNYHPHGDSSVYEAMVRMSQDFKMRELLVEMHGNNGSIDGDSAAAMRYTEAKLSQYAELLLKDIDLETVKMIYNFDDTEYEPTVLPTRVPNLLINGASGIASGYATEIAPHNPKEIIQALIELNKNPEMTLDEVLKYVKGPDFPTGGTIQGTDQLKSAYETGKGKFVIRAKYELKDNEIIITEIPYDVNKSNLVHKIDLIRYNQKVNGLLEVIDQSDQKGLEIVIKCKKGTNLQVVINYLFKNTDLQKTYHLNMTVIDKRRPRRVGLLSLLESFLTHRQDVITLRTRHLLQKDETRLHIVEGLKTAILNLDVVIKIIRGSKDKSDAKVNLEKQLKISEKQSEAIVMMQLYRLTNTDISVLEEEYQKLLARINHHKSILNDKQILLQVIEQELLEVLELVDKKRKTKIEKEIEVLEVKKQDLIALENVAISISENGYIKRSTLRSFSTTSAPPQLEEDRLITAIKSTTKNNLYVFLSNGNYLKIPVFEIADLKWKVKGKHISDIAKVEDGVKVVGACDDEHLKTHDILQTTKQGYVTRVEFLEYDTNKVNNSIVGQKVKSDDEIVDVKLIENNETKVLALTDTGEYIYLDHQKHQAGKLKRVGIKAGRLKKGQTIATIAVGKVGLIMTDKGGFFKYNVDNLPENTSFKPLFSNFKSSPHKVVYSEKVENSQVITIVKDNLWYNIEVNGLKEYPLGEKLKLIKRNLTLDSAFKNLLIN